MTVNSCLSSPRIRESSRVLSVPRRLCAQSASSQSQQQQQQLVEGVPDAEVEFQEQLIQEREGEIEQIEQGITELNQIFKDLGQIVGEQQSMIGELCCPDLSTLNPLMSSCQSDNIETNVRSVASDTRNASVQLTEAHAYQRRAGRRMICLFLVFLLVLSIVLLAVSPPPESSLPEPF